jgi:hypothetical protein
MNDMKRALLFVAFMTLAGSLFAQNPENGWPQRQDRERISIDPNGQDITIDRNSFVWRPFDDTVGYSLYGSRYRKAKASKGWGVFLSCIAAPASAVLLVYGIDEGGIAPAVLGGVGLAGSLGGGIPLWVKGRRELDKILDDYAERYAPRPYAASITAGPTRNGFGLALNF